MEETIRKALESVTSLLTGLGSGIAGISIILGAFMMMSTDSQKIEKGKSTIKISAIALLIVIASSTIVSWVEGLV